MKMSLHCNRIALSIIFFLVLSERLLPALGILIDPQSPGTQNKTFTHCLESGESLKIGNPFDAAEWNSSNFIFMTWRREINKEDQTLANFRIGGKESSEVSRVSIFQKWGIEISPVEMSDTAEYKAELKRKTTPKDVSFRVDVASAPKLSSDKLKITVKGKGPDMLLCGQFASLGQPAINIVWKDKHGKTLESTFKDGFQVLDLSQNSTSGSSPFVCEVEASSPALSCIPQQKRHLWNAQTYGKDSSKDDKTKIIVGAVVGGIALIIVVAAILCIISRKRTNRRL